MKTDAFGRMPDGRTVLRHVLCAERGGITLELIEFGGTVRSLHVRGIDGRLRNVVLGYPTLGGYLGSPHYLGASIGRYANRIRGGNFPLSGKSIRVPVNDRGHSLHGGPEGFDRQLWSTSEVSESHAILTHDSPAGHQGFPGRVRARVGYSVTDTSVRIVYSATTDESTIVNLTNHSYFNLDGDTSTDVRTHHLTVEADSYTPVDAKAIPLLRNRAVDGTPFDLRRPTAIGSALRTQHPQLRAMGGFDHNFLVDGSGLRSMATLSSRGSGINMDLRGTPPGLQVYTGNAFGADKGDRFRRHAGLALEPQAYPDTPNRPEFPSVELHPGELYESTIELTFGRSE